MELETHKGVQISFDGQKFSGTITGLATGYKTITRSSLAAVKKAIDAELANAITASVEFFQARSYSDTPSAIKVMGLKKTRDKYGVGYELVIERSTPSPYYGKTTEVKFDTLFIKNKQTEKLVNGLAKLEEEKRAFEERHRLAYRALRDQLTPFEVKGAEAVEKMLIEASHGTPLGSDETVGAATTGE